MDILVNSCDGFPEDSMLSVRAGNVVKRQAPMEPGKPIKFPWDAVRGPGGDLTINEVTVEVLAVLGRAKLMVDSHTDKCGLSFQATAFNSSCENRKTTCDLEVRMVKGEIPVPSKAQLVTKPLVTHGLRSGSGSAVTASTEKRTASRGRAAGHRHTHAISAQKYMNQHQLLEAMHSALQAAVSDRPEDPLMHMAHKLMKLAEDSKSSKQSSVASKHRPKGKGETETPGCSPAVEAQKVLESTIPVGGDSNATSAAAVSDVVPDATRDAMKAISKPAPVEVVSDAAIDTSISQPAPELSPTEVTRPAQLRGFTLPPLEPGSAQVSSGGRALVNGAPPKLYLAASTLGAASEAQTGDIEGELDHDLDVAVQEQAGILVEESLYEASKQEQRTQTAQAAELRFVDSELPTEVAPPPPELLSRSGSPDLLDDEGSPNSAFEREQRAKAAELRNTRSDGVGPALQSLVPAGSSGAGVVGLTPCDDTRSNQGRTIVPPTDDGRQVRPESPDEVSRRERHAFAAELRQTPPSSPQGVLKNIRESLEEAGREIPPLVSPRPASLATTVDQCLLDDSDVGGFLVQDLAKQGRQQIFCRERLDPLHGKTLDNLRQRLLSGVAAKVETGRFESLVQNIFA